MTNKTHKLSKTRKHINKSGIDKLAKLTAEADYKDIKVHVFKVLDGYHEPWYKLERLGSRLLGDSLERYLAKRQHLSFDHPKNKAKKVLYTLPSFPEWATLMPGALALEPVHNPEQKRMPSGKRLDPLTRRLFRHSLDPIGVRTRTLMGGWLARQYVKSHPAQPIRWLSMAGGTAAPSMLMIHASQANKDYLHYADIDIDENAIKIAKQIIDLEGLNPENTKLLAGDIFDQKLIDAATGKQPVDIVEMMGIFEYLDEKESTKLLRLAYGLLKTNGMIIAGNMRRENKHLNVHKRGVGWPSVIPRTVDDLIPIFQAAGINNENVSIYQPVDGVYNVMCIRKT